MIGIAPTIRTPSRSWTADPLLAGGWACRRRRACAWRSTADVAAALIAPVIGFATHPLEPKRTFGRAVQRQGIAIRSRHGRRDRLDQREAPAPTGTARPGTARGQRARRRASALPGEAARP